MADPRLVLVTIPDCHLCEVARSVVADVAAARGIAWREDDLTELSAPPDDWWEQVPVVLVDGAVVAIWRVAAADLDRALSTR